MCLTDHGKTESNFLHLWSKAPSLNDYTALKVFLKKFFFSINLCLLWHKYKTAEASIQDKSLLCYSGNTVNINYCLLL